MSKTDSDNSNDCMSNEFIALLIGACVGLILASLYFYATNNADIAAGTIANSIIALCTFIALIISYFSIQSQKENRRWEINKDLLIKLSTSLSDHMVQTERLMDKEFDHMQGIPNNDNITWDPAISKKFNESLSHTVQVYGVLLNKEIIDAVENYKKNDKNISYSFEISEFNAFEAYDASLAAQSDLMKVLNKNIKIYAAI